MNIISTTLMLTVSVLILFCYILIGFLLKKYKLVDNSFSKALSHFTLYVASPGMFIQGFLRDFEFSVFFDFVGIFVASLIIHAIFYIIAIHSFKQYEGKVRVALQYAAIFANVGYMGIPLVRDVLGQEFVIYVTAYIIGFNLFQFSLGRYLFTSDKSYISVKKMFLNPAIIPITIGFVIYVTGLGGWFAHCGQICADKIDIYQHGVLIGGSALINQIANVLSNCVAPVSMVLIGSRLAEVDMKAALKDVRVYLLLLTRLLVFPAIILVLCIIAHLFGLFTPQLLLILVVLSAAPVAANLTIFSEIYNGLPSFSGELVAISTLSSIITMPILAFVMSYLTSVIPVLF